MKTDADDSQSDKELSMNEILVNVINEYTDDSRCVQTDIKGSQPKSTKAVSTDILLAEKYLGEYIIRLENLLDDISDLQEQASKMLSAEYRPKVLENNRVPNWSAIPQQEVEKYLKTFRVISSKVDECGTEINEHLIKNLQGHQSAFDEISALEHKYKVLNHIFVFTMGHLGGIAGVSLEVSLKERDRVAKERERRSKGGQASKKNKAIIEAVRKFISAVPKRRDESNKSIANSFRRHHGSDNPIDITVDSGKYEVFYDGGIIDCVCISGKKAKYNNKTMAYTTFQARYIGWAKEEIIRAKM
jgi:hypothetical protein